MLDLIKTPFSPTFQKFAKDIVTDCFICSPYITSGPVKMLIETIAEKKPNTDIKINVLTDISYRTLVQGSTEILALMYLFENHHNVCITYLPRIHAKVYIANQSNAVIASANFSQGGGKVNFEYGVKVSDSAVVRKIQADMEEYRKLGADITQNQLEILHPQIEETKRMIEAEQKNIKRTIKLQSANQQREIEDNLIRIRVKNRNTHSIFSETLLYLLSKGPAQTKELNMLISGIHPDLCDDRTDRVIDGTHYGKLWKHQVRSAQVNLKRSGLIVYDQRTKLWNKAKK